MRAKYRELNFIVFSGSIRDYFLCECSFSEINAIMNFKLLFITITAWYFAIICLKNLVLMKLYFAKGVLSHRCWSISQLTFIVLYQPLPISEQSQQTTNWRCFFFVCFFFHTFSKKAEFDIWFKLSTVEIICMKYQILFYIFYSRRQIGDIFFLIFPENRIWHFMQTVVIFCIFILNFTLLWARQQTDEIFHIFPIKQDLTFMRIVSIGDKCRICQILFSGKKRENYYNMSSAENFIQHAKRLVR